MPGFSEYSKHDSFFNSLVSDRDVRDRDLEGYAYGHFSPFRGRPIWCKV